MAQNNTFLTCEEVCSLSVGKKWWLDREVFLLFIVVDG